MPKISLFSENFRSFPIGPFPSVPGAEGEYHYLDPGYRGIWYEPNKSTDWQRLPLWRIRERDGQHEMEQGWSDPVQQLSGQTTIPMLVTGDLNWSSYTFAARVWPLASRNKCGIACLYQDSRHFTWFCLADGSKAELWQKNDEEVVQLAQADYAYHCDQAYTLKVTMDDNELSCWIDDSLIFKLASPGPAKGRVALAALTPTRFLSAEAWMAKPDYENFISSRQAGQASAEQKQSQYPQPILKNILDLKDFGAARSIRYGDLTGDGQIDLLFIQNQPFLNNDNECMISCLTAVNLAGEILWQLGEPNPANGMITADVPVQIYDLDGDGNQEVIYCKDFKIIVADGKTGRTKFQAATPHSIPAVAPIIYQNIVFDRIVGDSIRICNISGKARPADILVKDRYNNIWLYDDKLQFIWHKQLNTGHFPVNFDINGDGFDEIIASHTLLDRQGRIIWQVPNMHDHVDEIAVGCFNPELQGYQIAMAAGEDGFLLLDQDGRILVQDFIGHAQRVSVAKYRPDLPGLQFCVVTYWRNTGIIVYYDCCGNRIYSIETGANGNVLTPVNWLGQEQQLILYSASRRYGGLYDGYGDRVVDFPDDGHPELCCEAIDLYDQGRDTLLAWDTKKMYVYIHPEQVAKQRPLLCSNELYNYSNYRAEYSWIKQAEINK